jgi:beta-barrel assembly-enhancing protease
MAPGVVRLQTVRAISSKLVAGLAAAALSAATGGAWAQASSTPTQGNGGNVPLGPPPTRTSLPDLGSSANSLISRADEYQIGRMIMRDLRNETRLLDDIETTEYLQALGSRIGVEAQEGEARLTFFAVHESSINAFALPGGFIGVNTGLILQTNAESELAGVMAHEIGHVVQRHIARAVQAQGRNSIATMAGMLGAILIGAATGNADALPGIVAIAQGTAMQQQINFTRMEEHEADRVGIGYLATAGFDPNGMVGFFGTMMRERGVGGDDIPALLLTHPVDTVRIAEARARLHSMPAYPRRPDSALYPYIRERLRVLTSGVDSNLHRYYERMRVTDANNPALAYGAALAELKAENPRRAIELLKPLVAQHPQLPLLHVALAQAQLADGHKSDAVGTFEHAMSLTPRNLPLTVRYAEALLALGQPKKAHELLLDLFNNVPPSPEQIRLIALAASAAGDTGDAYYYMAELHIASGDLMLATTQLDLAPAAPGLTDVQRKRFLARRAEIRGYLREQRGDRASREPPPG